MADEESIFQDGGNLQAAIGRSIQEKRALLCFVSDDGDESTRWEVALLDDRIRRGLQARTVALRLQAGSEQAGFLNTVCPIQSVPAIIGIHNAQVVANWQHGQVEFEELLTQLAGRYGQHAGQATASSSATDASTTLHMDLPPSEGRMRLPNNSYHHFRTLTERMLAAGVKSKLLLQMQLRWLEQMNVDVVTAAVKNIQARLPSLTQAPTLPEEVQNRLLNTPASMLNGGRLPGDAQSESLQTPSTGSSTQVSASSRTATTTTTTANRPSQRAQPTEPQPQPPSSTDSSPAQPSSSPSNTPPPSSSISPSTSTSQATQRTAYTTRQRTLEQSQRAERERIKAQIATDKQARREAEAARLAAQRRTDLAALRKANSTTANPQSSDVRIQVRLFDGSTIRNSFAYNSTISQDVRTWIDGTVRSKAAAGGQAGQPYDLKLILTPLPNRTIEAGEEDNALSDVEGIGSSATMVMVPVKGYVESYVASGGGGVTGMLGSAISGGVGLVGTGVGMVVGGIGRLLGAGSGSPAGPSPQAGGANVPTERASAQGRTASEAAGSGNVKVRTLADQRRDEEDERRERGTQLYNGMGLNVQPRRGEEDDAK